MEVYRRSSWLLLYIGVFLFATTLQGVIVEAEPEGPSEQECRPYIEKALKVQSKETGEPQSIEVEGEPTIASNVVEELETTPDDSSAQSSEGENDRHEEESRNEEHEEQIEEQNLESQTTSDGSNEHKDENEESQAEVIESTENIEKVDQTESENVVERAERSIENESGNETVEETNSVSVEDETQKPETETENTEQLNEEETPVVLEEKASVEVEVESPVVVEEVAEQSQEAQVEEPKQEEVPSEEDSRNSTEEQTEEVVQEAPEPENVAPLESAEVEATQQVNEIELNVVTEENTSNETVKQESVEDLSENVEENVVPEVQSLNDPENTEVVEEASNDKKPEENSNQSEDNPEQEIVENTVVENAVNIETQKSDENKNESTESTEDSKSDGESYTPEELSLNIEIPSELRPRDHVEQLLKLDKEASESEKIINQISDITLKELKKIYENAIKPLEVPYKYRDLSNRHFGDSEIFSKPIILFMGPWSAGKSSIINYLLDNEYNETSLRTGAEPSPAYFNILTHGDEPEVIDGTQLVADFTFSGLQKFGQGLEERLRGIKLPSRLLEKLNIVEIPGILEVRKQVSRVFPFNDACQWFIDRADIIFLVYDPSKLDVGPETEAILDQLKGREHQTRIILNKADQVKPEELMRVQGALIWNISPLMSSPQPPVMYTTSLWSRPYEPWAPVRLLHAQERAFLRDMRTAVDKLIENKIASARRFAVRVRNHAKMVDCYLTTYYNHKSMFGNRKQVANEIIEHPQNYHIYEGLSTLTNISRYDLPDPDVYRDFFNLNPLYDFQQLSATCTYFRGCPINRLDVAIAYDLPELNIKHRKLVESALNHKAAASTQKQPSES